MHIVQEEIGKPHLSIQKVSETLAKFIIAPLPAGFGHTLGNALRRTLLSSVPGAGIVGIKVKGVAHEYTSLSGVSDSVLDIILNLKGVFFQKHTKDSETLVLEKKGEGPVFASDITLSGDTTVLNPDHVITYLDGKNTSISLEILLDKGVGYASAKDRQKKFGDLGWILVDAIFSPVRNVKYEVSPTRVGEMTDLDSLEIELETNGAISPEKAFQFAGQVLESYFKFFQNDPSETIEKDFIADFSVYSSLEDGSSDDQEAYTPIEILNLSPRTLNALINGNIGSVEEVLRSSPAHLESMRGFGKKAMTELSDALRANGYDFPFGE